MAGIIDLGEKQALILCNVILGEFTDFAQVIYKLENSVEKFTDIMKIITSRWKYILYHCSFSMSVEKMGCKSFSLDPSEGLRPI